MVDKRMGKLLKSRLSSSKVISLCARVRSTDNSFQDIYNKYDVHCEMPGKSVTKL